MRVFIVINHRLLLDALLGDRQRHMDAAVRARRRRQRRNLQRIQRLARVPVRNLRQMPQGAFVRENFQITQAAFVVFQRPL